MLNDDDGDDGDDNDDNVNGDYDDGEDCDDLKIQIPVCQFWSAWWNKIAVFSISSDSWSTLLISPCIS